MTLSAAQYAQLKLNLRAFSSANRYTVANLSEADLLGFWNQLVSDSASASTLPAAQDADVDRTLRAMLCANNSLVGLSDADWASLFTQLTTDASGASSLPVAQTAALRLQLRALISGYKSPPVNLSEADLLGYIKPRAGSFSGNFGALLDSLTSNATVGYFRGDLGLHVTGPVVNSWDNQISTGSPFGNINEGTGGVGIGNVSSGIGGKAGIANNGTTQFGTIITVPLPMVAPATTPLHVYAVTRSLIAAPGADAFFLGSSYSYAIYQTAGTTTLRAFNGSLIDTTVPTNTWGRLRKSWTGSASDLLRFGSAAAVGGSSGNGGAGAGLHCVFAGSPAGANVGTWETVLLMFSRATLAEFSAAMPAMDAAVASFYGGGVAV